MIELVGESLGQYKLLSVLGSGGAATVYRAQQLSIGREVAVKVIKSTNPDFARRFEREARTAASLSHLHILKVFDYGQQADFSYLVMELLAPLTLYDQILDGPIPLETAVRLIDQVASALDYAHQHGVIHRDLKPQNVLLDTHGNAFLSDFGISKLIYETTLTQSGMTMGTPAYMAPEQWQGGAIDARADIYAMGVMLFQMLSSQLPFNGDTPFRVMHMHIYESAPPLHQLVSHIPLAVEQVIEKAMSKSPDQRYSTALEMSTAFRQSAETTVPGPMIASALQTPERAQLPDTLSTPNAPLPIPEKYTNLRRLLIMAGVLAVLLTIPAITLVVVVASKGSAAINTPEATTSIASGETATSTSTITLTATITVPPTNTLKPTTRITSPIPVVQISIPAKTAFPSATMTATPTTSPTASVPTIRVKTSTNLRAGPGTHYETVGSADDGDVLTVIASVSGGGTLWYLARTERNNLVWIWAENVELSPGFTIEPAQTIPPTYTPTPTATYTPTDPPVINLPETLTATALTLTPALCATQSAFRYDVTITNNADEDATFYVLDAFCSPGISLQIPGKNATTRIPVYEGQHWRLITVTGTTYEKIGPQSITIP